MKISTFRFVRASWLKNTNRGALVIVAVLLTLGGLGAAQTWQQEEPAETPPQIVAQQQTGQPG